MELGLVAIIAFVLFLLVVGTGMFMMLLGGKEKGTGSKIGIIIAVVAFGMFFLVCLGAPFVYWTTSMQSAESHRREAVQENLRQIGESLHQHEQRKSAQQSIRIPVKPKTATAKKPSKVKRPLPKTKSVIKTVPPPMPKNATPASIKKHQTAKIPVNSKPKPAQTAAVKKNIKIETPPEWIQQSTLNRDKKTYLVLHSDEFATTAEAEADLLQKVKAQIKKQIVIDNVNVKPFRIDVFDDHCDVYGVPNTGRTRNTDARHEDYFVRTYGELYGMGFSTIDNQARLTIPRSAIPGNLRKSVWHVPEPVLQQTLKRQYDETVHRSTDKHEFKMHRAHAQILVTKKDLAFTWQTLQSYVTHQEEEVATHNIWKGATLLGMLTLLFGTITTYLRVDTLTKGAYRNRLRFASAGLLTLGISIGSYLLMNLV